MNTHFFEGGTLTSTSANHIANLAKEFIQQAKEKISHISFFTTVTSANGHDYTTRTSSTLQDIEAIPVLVAKIAKATELIAWLREALQEKSNAAVMEASSWCEANGITYPEAPKRQHVLTEEEIILSWLQEKYLALLAHQAYAAVVGEFIHPKGPVAEARKEFIRILNNPVDITGSGRDLQAAQHTATFSEQEVEDVFFSLQNKQREQQAQYNKLRHEIDSAIEQSQIDSDEKYSKEYQEYRAELQQILADYAAWANKERKRISSLKIAIPEPLKEIYEEVSQLGK